MNELDLLLSSIAEVDRQIAELRKQLDEHYDYRRVLVDQVVQFARERGYRDGYSNGEYRYHVVKRLEPLDVEGIASVAPELVEQKVVVQVDGRKLRSAWETGLREKLAPYVRETESHEVSVEKRKSVRGVADETKRTPFE
ncbi:MAG: hypothetical protein KatS3mg023_3591 [Armatimonadota bacterium]|nr:MAG: hypothetical protein KatS3mg023_3591 [Armatimonadota bacterium]